MKYDAFVLSDQIKTHEVEYFHYPQFWDDFDYSELNRISPLWHEIRFLNDDGDDISDSVKEMPADKGGIYMFIIKCPILPTITEHLAYIGRAQFSQNHNLRIRCRKYLYEYCSPDGRPKVSRMIHKWGKYLYIKYAAIDNNDDIISLEANLINAILPPFNDEIPDKKTKDAVQAF